jgi:hypothetical protein
MVGGATASFSCEGLHASLTEQTGPMGMTRLPIPPTRKKSERRVRENSNKNDEALARVEPVADDALLLRLLLLLLEISGERLRQTRRGLV